MIQSLNVHVTAHAIIVIICCDQVQASVAKQYTPVAHAAQLLGRTSTDLCRLRKGLGADNRLISNTHDNYNMIMT